MQTIRDVFRSNGFLVLFLIAIATSPAFALDESNRNMLLVLVMGVSPFVILRYLEVDKIDLTLTILCGFNILSTLLFHPESVRWISMLFTVGYCLFFMAYNRLLRHAVLEIPDYMQILKFLIYAYTVVLLIQQFCVLVGLPVFMQGNVDVNQWKLNSLTSEPSHSVRFIALMMYSYLTMQMKIAPESSFSTLFKGNKWLWAAFLWSMVTVNSGTAYLFLAIVLFKFVKIKYIFRLIPLVVVIIILGYLFGITAFERTANLAMATLTLNESAIFYADPSGSYRIIPMIACAKMIDLATIDGWFGHGVDYVAIQMSSFSKFFRGGGGGVLHQAVEYGFISFLIFTGFSFFMTFNKRDYLSILFWVFMCLNEGINMQLTWAAIVFLYTNKIMMKRWDEKYLS